MWRDCKYPEITEFLSPAPAAPGQLDPSSYPPYANVATPDPGRPRKKNKGKGVATAAQVTTSSLSVAPKKGTVMLQAANRPFFTPRSSPLPHQDALRIAANAANITASVLIEAKCLFPCIFTVTDDPCGLLTLTSTCLHTPATAFAPFYEVLTNKLNQSFPIGNNPFLPFRPAPHEVHIAIHWLPYGLMPTESNNLVPALNESIRNATDVGISSARFPQSDPAKRAKRSCGAVGVSVSPSDVVALGSSIWLFLRSRQVEWAYSSNPMTKCKFCFSLGHPT